MKKALLGLLIAVALIVAGLEGPALAKGCSATLKCRCFCYPITKKIVGEVDVDGTCHAFWGVCLGDCCTDANGRKKAHKLCCGRFRAKCEDYCKIRPECMNFRRSAHAVMTIFIDALER